MPQTGKTQIANVNSFYDRDLLLRVQPLLVHTRWAQVRDLPSNNSDVIKFRRYSNLSAATTPLTEGITPVGSQLSVTTISATVLQYGDYVVLTDKLTMETEDPIRTETNEILADQAADTLDQLCRDVLVTGTNILYAGSGHTLRSQVAAGEVLTTTMLITAAETLKIGKTRFVTMMVDPTTGINTSPLPQCFIGICHTYTTKTLRAMSGWIEVEKYANGQTRMDGEIGKYGDIRFIETTNAKVFTGAGASSIDVYATIIMGKYAYATSRIGGNALRNIVKAAGSAGTADPLEQRETSGWKASFVTKILNDDFIIRLEHARV